MIVQVAAALLLSAGAAVSLHYAGAVTGLRVLDLSPTDTGIVAIAVFGILMGMFAAFHVRRVDRRLVTTIKGLERFENDIARQISELRSAVRVAERPVRATEPAPTTPATAKTAPDDEAFEREDRDFPARIAPASQRAEEPEEESPPDPHASAAIRQGEVVAWFEPVVSLPERLTRYMEAKAYLPDRLGVPRPPEKWQEGIRPKSLLATADLQMLHQCTRLARELARDGRNCGVILGLCWRESALQENSRRFLDLLSANRGVADRMVFDISEAEFTRNEIRIRSMMRQMRDMGFLLSLSRCDNTSTAKTAFDSGLFRFAMPNPRLLLSVETLAMFRGLRVTDNSGTTAPVQIIAKGVENEETAIELIDQDILLAQGPLFLPARPLRTTAPTNTGNPIPNA